MKINCFLIFGLTVVFLVACKPESQNKELIYQNIVIFSDMSSRLRALPLKDTSEIYKLVEYFKRECVKPGQKIGDKSSISFAALSERNKYSIDIDQIKPLGEKQSFINSTGKYENSGLEQKLKEFKIYVKNVYDSIRNPGLDLISILCERIKNEPILKHNTFLTDGIDTTFINFENHIYVFTDGYLEYKNPNTNHQFYFGDDEITRIRNYMLKNNVSVEDALNTDASLGLAKYFNEKFQNVHLHIWETYERDKDRRLQKYKHPVGQRDNEILEAVWRKWAKESGFKSFEWRRY